MGGLGGRGEVLAAGAHGNDEGEISEVVRRRLFEDLGITTK